MIGIDILNFGFEWFVFQKRNYHTLKRIGGFAHSRNHHPQGVFVVLLQNGGDIAHGFGMLYRSATKLKNLHNSLY